MIPLEDFKEWLRDKDSILPEYMRDTLIHVAEKLAIDVKLKGDDDDE